MREAEKVKQETRRGKLKNKNTHNKNNNNLKDIFVHRHSLLSSLSLT